MIKLKLQNLFILLMLHPPGFTNNKNENGLITMTEILSLKLDADWVVLSTCNTGASNGKGTGAISGISMAFFYAGTRAMLVSHWPVETTSARFLTTHLFKNQVQDEKLSRSAALANTINEMIDSGIYKDKIQIKHCFHTHIPCFGLPLRSWEMD